MVMFPSKSYSDEVKIIVLDSQLTVLYSLTHMLFFLLPAYNYRELDRPKLGESLLPLK